MSLKRGRTRMFGEVGDDVDSVVDAVLGLCGGGDTKKYNVGDLTQQIESLVEELDGMGDDEATQLREKRYKRRLGGCAEVLRMFQRARSGNGPKNPLADTATQTLVEGVAVSAVDARGGGPSTPKKPRLSTPAVVAPLVPASPSGPSTPMSPQLQGSPRTAPSAFSLNPMALDASLDLSEADMVRIAAELIFSIMRVAQRGDHICTLNELFIEADQDADEGISFTELLVWVKGTLGIAVSDWQLDGFGKILKWEKECQKHPKRFIDPAGFLRIIRDVWAKVKWYFDNAVVYGVSQPDQAAVRRTNDVLDLIDKIREPMQGFIKYLVIQNCHIHTFFAHFDTERKQRLSVTDVARIFWMLRENTRVASEEEAKEVATQCCVLANTLFPKPPDADSSPLVPDADDDDAEPSTITLFQLQDLVRDFFAEFRRRLEYNVLEDEARPKFVVRKFFFKLVGVTESDAITPITNTFALISKYSNTDGNLDPSGLQQLLKQEFDVALTVSELRDVISIVDKDHDFVLDVNEFTGFVDMSYAEIKQQMAARMPSDFQVMNAHAVQLQPECVHVFAKLILRILHTSETFAGFFKHLPRFRPSESFAMVKDTARYPDEVVLGLRRVGIHSTPDIFHGWGGPVLEGWTGLRWGPTRSVLDQEHFLDAIWKVWSQYIEPAFQVARNWETEASSVSSQCLDAAMKHLKITVPPGPDALLQIWNALPKTDDGASVPTRSFIDMVLEAVKRHTDKIASRATLTSPAVLKSTEGEEALFERELKQLLNFAAAGAALSKEQMAAVLWRGR